MELTQSRLKELLDYNPETGLFIRKVSVNSFAGKAKSGAIAGSVGNSGYLRTGIDGKEYRLNRLAWLYMTGKMPNGIIDHKNHIITDNRFDNLRDVTDSHNSQNIIKSHKDNTSGFLGVSYQKRNGRFVASICVNRHRIHLGTFYTAEIAHQAYLTAKRLHHPTCMI